MKIGLHNYEAFFLDHIEGNLDAAQERELFAFLEEHPELKAELDSYDPDSYREVLEPESIFENKPSLKKKEFTNEALITYIEGLSDAQSRKEIEALASENSAFNTELTLYKSTILSAEEIRCPAKSKLKRGGVIIYLQSNPAFLRVAAAILLLVGLFFLVSKFNTNESTKGIKPVLAADTKKEITAPVQTNKVINEPLENKNKLAFASQEKNQVKINKQNSLVNEEKRNDPPKLATNTVSAVNNNLALNHNANGPDTLSVKAIDKNIPAVSNSLAANTVTYKSYYNYEEEEEEDEKPPVTASAAPGKKTFFQKLTTAARKVNALGVKKVGADENEEKKSLKIGGLVVSESVTVK